MDALLQNGDGLHQVVLNSLLEPAVIINKEGIIVAANDAWLGSPIHSGKLLDTYPGSVYWDLLEDQEDLKAGIMNVLMAKLNKYSQRVIYDESRTWAVRATPLKVSQTMIIGAVVMYFDITDSKRLERLLQTGAEQYRLIAEHSRDMIKVTDIHGDVEYASPSHQNILGCTDDANIFKYIHPEDARSLKELCHEILLTKESRSLELRKKHKNGDWVWVETACSPVLLDGTVQNFIFITREIGERKQMEYELERMAYYDFLTGLFNRRKMRVLMEEALEEASNNHEKFAILIMDLDKFKLINDTHGHDVGDIVLKEFASRLLENKGDSGIVGRLSGDEFVVLMKQVNGKLDIQHFSQRLHDALVEPCDISHLDCSIQMKASVGYSVYPDHGDTVMMLFKHADIALYKEKKKQIKIMKTDSAKQIRLKSK